MSYFQRRKPDYRIESLYTTGPQKKIDCFNAVGFNGPVSTVLEAMNCFYHYSPCQEAPLALTGKNIEGRTKRKRWMKCRGSILNRNVTLCRNVGFWMVETLQDWCTSKSTLQRIIPLQASIASGTVFGQDKIRRFIWLLKMSRWSSRKSERKICQYPAIIRKHRRI